MDGPKSIIKRSYTAIFFPDKIPLWLLNVFMVKNWENLSRRCAEHVSQNSDFELDKCLDDDGQGSNTKTLLFFHISLKILLNFFKIVIFSRNEKIEILNQHLFFLDRWTTKHKHSFLLDGSFESFVIGSILSSSKHTLKSYEKLKDVQQKQTFWKVLFSWMGLCISICIKSENLSHPRHVCLLILELPPVREDQGLRLIMD